MKRLPLAHAAYRLVLWALCPALLGWLWWRGRQDPGYRERFRERLGFIQPAPASLEGILVHAASVGEVQAARPLIAALRREWPDHSLTITTQSPTGARQVLGHWGGALQHLFFPLDTRGATRRFLDRLRPRLVVLIERELWPEMLRQCAERGIPVALVNARLSAPSAQTYRRWAPLMRPIWSQLALVACADAESLQRLQALGVPPSRLQDTGNLKFDQPLPEAVDTAAPWLSGRSAVLIAGSTHEGEESALLAAWPAFAQRHPGAALVLVPRHPERFDAVAQQIAGAGFQVRRRSRGDTLAETDTVYLADSMGELARWYAQASACFIGGSLAPIGGHNALEALALGKPVLYGPHTHNFESLYDTIGQQALGQRVASAPAALDTLTDWLRDPEALQHRGAAARQFVQSQQGSTAQTLQALGVLWQPLAPLALAPVAAEQTPGETVWFNPQRLSQAGAGLFEAPAQALALATGSGRGQAHRLCLQGHDLVLRHYRRGGLMARLSRDRFAPEPTAHSRAMAEYRLLRLMRAWNLPVPEAMAARQQRHAWGYSADILVAMIPDTQNLVQALSARALSDTDWQAVGQAVRQLHDRQVFHSDLNAHNLLLDARGRAWIIDFDKCGERPGESWKAQNLARLLRSLHKEQGRCPVFHWAENRDWPALLMGYNRR